jgi:L-ascorbate metabolism protein UlaG (beta-lactamase superfamily)
MVSADHSSSCMGLDGEIVNGGCPTGFVIKAHDFSIYHAGDTNVFTGMEIIDTLYKPTHLLLPIGGNFTMGPYEAGFAVAKYFTQAKVVIPMHFGTFPAMLYGTFEDF